MIVLRVLSSQNPGELVSAVIRRDRVDGERKRKHFGTKPFHKSFRDSVNFSDENCNTSHITSCPWLTHLSWKVKGVGPHYLPLSPWTGTRSWRYPCLRRRPSRVRGCCAPSSPRRLCLEHSCAPAGRTPSKASPSTTGGREKCEHY